ncbi:unnamed protein product [Schistosoma curassoni]|uniref:Secreted protein n=1 Tax=Schistosoma curassoni TaxID=6186 RepID=A0A183KMA8_9TREM|nr:unnamed protein product [Schistosoma curassoni]
MPKKYSIGTCNQVYRWRYRKTTMYLLLGTLSMVSIYPRATNHLNTSLKRNSDVIRAVIQRNMTYAVTFQPQTTTTRQIEVTHVLGNFTLPPLLDQDK